MCRISDCYSHTFINTYGVLMWKVLKQDKMLSKFWLYWITARTKFDSSKLFNKKFMIKYILTYKCHTCFFYQKEHIFILSLFQETIYNHMKWWEQFTIITLYSWLMRGSTDQWYCFVKSMFTLIAYPDSKVHGAIMGPIWGQQDPGGPHVGLMNFAIWVYMVVTNHHMFSLMLSKESMG